IDRPKLWTRAARRALAAAGSGAFVSLGVPARGPETGYGYLVCDRRPDGKPVRVTRFVEKPSPGRARALPRTGRCLWNSGSFAARVDSFLGELGRQRPDILRAAEAAADGRAAMWKRLAPISVDYAVLEGAPGVRAIRLDSGWDDLGSW